MTDVRAQTQETLAPDVLSQRVFMGSLLMTKVVLIIATKLPTDGQVEQIPISVVGGKP